MTSATCSSGPRRGRRPHASSPVRSPGSCWVRAACGSGASSTSSGRFARSPDADDVLAAIPDGWAARDLVDPTPLRCPDPDAERAMLVEVDAAKEAGDSIGGSFVVVAEGTPIGLGSSSEWDTRLDGALAGATMAIPGVKGVEIGLGFGVVDRRGSAVHDVVDAASADWRRATNRAGGIEGGISNGEPIVVRAAQKPVSTLRVAAFQRGPRERGAGTRAHRALRRHGPGPRGDRRRGDGRADPRRRAPLLVRRRHDR